MRFGLGARGTLAPNANQNLKSCTPKTPSLNPAKVLQIPRSLLGRLGAISKRAILAAVPISKDSK